jgi:hypothetical protein
MESIIAKVKNFIENLIIIHRPLNPDYTINYSIIIIMESTPYEQVGQQSAPQYGLFNYSANDKQHTPRQYSLNNVTKVPT